MRTLRMTFLVGTVLAFGPAVWAGSSLSTTLGSLSPNDDVTWIDYQSGSWAVAGNGSLSQSVDDFQPQADTVADASVTGPEAGALAVTQAGEVGAFALATTGPGSSAAYAYAEQTIRFMAGNDTVLQFDMDFTITHLLSSQLGETAFADSSVGLSLYREDGTLVMEAPSYYTSNFVENGDSLSLPDFAGTLSVLGSFASQEVGYLWLRVDGQATAAVIPAPGALLLGAIGTGLIGFLRRRVL